VISFVSMDGTFTPPEATVMLAEAEPSDGIEAVSLVTARVATVPPVVDPPPPELPVPSNELPPHAASNNVNADSAAIETNLRIIHPD
jgi:hypothetical protein